MRSSASVNENSHNCSRKINLPCLRVQNYLIEATFSLNRLLLLEHLVKMF